ncbi:hypothetical protein Aperf_G00000092409 [Anoplocephala perfoliata]
MSQGLPNVLASGFKLEGPPFGPLNGKPGSPSASSPENNNSASFTPPASSSLHFPGPEKPVQTAVSNDTAKLKEKLLAALSEIIPHKSSLSLRMLVAYTVDNVNSNVIVIDETLNHKQSDQPTTGAAGSILDLSQKPEEPVKPSLSGNDLGSILSAPTLPFLNLVSSQAAPLGVPQPSNPTATPALNQEAALLVLQTLLNNHTNTNLPQLGSFNFSLPMNLPPLSTDSKLSVLPSEIAPNVTITNNDSILPNLQFGSRTAATLSNPNDSGSRSSSPLSNQESSSPTLTFRPLPKVPSQATFGRRYVHPRRFICNQCRQQFSSLAELNRHTLEVHNSFRCNFCQAKFTQRSNLQRHSLKHVGFKPFTCNICQKEYYRKDHLVRHIEVTHPNVDPRLNITTRLTSSECLDFLDNLHIYGNTESTFEDNSAPSSLNGTGVESRTSPSKSDEGMGVNTEGPALTSSTQELGGALKSDPSGFDKPPQSMEEN